MQKLKASQSQTHEKILQVHLLYHYHTIPITITITVTIAITSAELAQRTHVCQTRETVLIVWHASPLLHRDMVT